MAPLPPRRPAPAAPSIAMPTPVPTPTPTRTSARPISTRRTPSRPTHPLPPLPSEANMTKSIETESAQPQFYNADALKSLNANATRTSAPKATRTPTRRRAGAFQKFSPRTPRTMRTSQPCSPTPSSYRSPRRRCSAHPAGSPQRYKTVGEASVERALGSMMHSLRLAATLPSRGLEGREISRWSSSTDGSERDSGISSSFTTFFGRKTHSADSGSTAPTDSSFSINRPETADKPADAASIKSTKSAHSLRSVRSFASFRSTRSTRSAHSGKSAVSTKSRRKWHWGRQQSEDIPPIPAWNPAAHAARRVRDAHEDRDVSSSSEDTRILQSLKERPRKIVGGFLKRLTPRRRLRQPQGMSPEPSEHVYAHTHDESAPSSLGRASGSHASTPFEDDEVLRSSAKALAVLGLIDSRLAHNGHSHSRPESVASESSHHSRGSGSQAAHGHNHTVHSHSVHGHGHSIHLPHAHGPWSQSPTLDARHRASSRPPRKAYPSSEWPARPRSVDGERSSSLPPRRSSLRIPAATRTESGGGSHPGSSVTSPAPSFANLWGSQSSTEHEAAWATPPPPPRRRLNASLPCSSLSISGQARSSLDGTSTRHPSQTETDVQTPRSRVRSIFSDDAVTFTPRSRQRVSSNYESPRVHDHLEGKIHDALQGLTLDEVHMSQRRARAAALAAAADPLKPRRLICEMRSRSRIRADADDGIDFTRSPSAQSIPLPPSPEMEETALPYGRSQKGRHSPSASVHTFGHGGSGHFRSGSVDTMSSLLSSSAPSVYTIRDGDTVELLYGQYGQPNEWEYDDADRPIDFTRALAYSQPTSWTRPGTPEEGEDAAHLAVGEGVTVW